MRTTVTIDDNVYNDAVKNRPNATLKELLDEALRTFNQLEASRRLAKMAGTMPELEIPARKRTKW